MSADSPNPDPLAPSSARWRLFVELTKPRITLMVVITTLVGFLVVAPRPLDWLLLVHTLLGTALVAAGAATLNQYVERDTDARMRRTAKRPLPAGHLRPAPVLFFGVGIALVGMAYLSWQVNVLTALLGGFTLVKYVFVYTPMKLRSELNTLVGAVPGAVPPMMGVTAVTGSVDLLAWALFGILFFWQMPHFLAIAWLYRSDYGSGGFPMLTVADPSGLRTSRQMVLYAAALVPVSLLPSVLGAAGWIYLFGALIFGLVFLGYSAAFGFKLDMRSARRVLLISVAYLPIVLILMVLDRTA